MFDETKKPVDIFDGVEKAPAAPQATLSGQGGLPPAMQARVPQAPPMNAERVVRRGPSVLVFLVVLIILAGIGGTIWYFFLRTKTETPVVPAASGETPVIPAPDPSRAEPREPESTTPTPAPVTPTPAPEPGIEAPSTEPAVEVPADTDSDGLSDAEEVTLGTDPAMTDTDGDGLIDREEVKIYATDPRNPDTDGDKYKDGEEVKNGYDPKGPGRLFQVPPAS